MARITLMLVIGVLATTISEVRASRRDKRYLFINPNAPITLGFLLNMPISLALPTLATVKGRALNLQGRLADPVGPEDLLWEPPYEEQLERLALYFAHLQLTSLSCQERLLCELASQPETFTPIGEIFLRELRLSHGPVKTSPDSLMWRYMSAAREGFVAPIEDCTTTYSSCQLPADRVLNMPVLKVWQYIATKLNLRLV